MKKLWITFLVFMLIVTTVVWGGYSFYVSSTEVNVNNEAAKYSTKIDPTFDMESLLIIEASVNEQEVDIAKYHELDTNGNVYEDLGTDSEVTEEIIP